MKQRPILFNSPMVRAVIYGSKTQTRRVVKPQPDELINGIAAFCPNDSKSLIEVINCPYGQQGDQLWVREKYEAYYIGREEFPSKPDKHTTRVRYYADEERREVEIDAITYRKLDSRVSFGWSPSIHMPRWASRLTLEIASIRV